MQDKLIHYGTPRHSGRYPWGSGDDPEQRNKSFRGYVKDLHKQGVSEVEIAKGLGMTVSQLRAKKSLLKDEETKANAATALKLKNKGYSNVEIGRQMGRNESYIRTLLDPTLKERASVTQTISNMLKDKVDEHKYIDVGVGSERLIGISRTKLKTSLAQLEDEGYKIHKFSQQQAGTGKNTTIMALTTADTTLGEVIKNKDKIKLVVDQYSEDGGRSFLGIEPVKSIDSKKILIRYGNEGGKDKDGVIELRRGVDEISLGDKRYAQVRIGVDGVHYLKGMAMYTDDIPEGINIIYNTNKDSSTPKEKVFKVMDPDMTHPNAKAIQELKIPKDEKNKLLSKGVIDGSIPPDPDNPFGSTIRQKHYLDTNGNKQLSALNIVGSKEGSGEEGSWEKWSKNLSSQMLSKQAPSLAKTQLDLAYKEKLDEYNAIMALTNPAVKKNLLKSFADDCDSSAVHLKAAALPRQGSRVILPIPSMKETEIYAPTYRNGEKVALIRYPHGGTFEIPELIVNNKQPTAKKTLGNVKDAVGIHPKVAERLSGADFDGDTVLVIPNNNKVIKTSARLKDLIDFEPRELYKSYDGMVPMDARTKGIKMGDVSNLITDMTIKGANTNEIARAVRHSMVVIDAEKHKLDYKKSYVDHGIADLKKKYQGGPNKGASTLISKASSEVRVNERKEGVTTVNPKTGKKKIIYIDPKTGKKLYRDTGATYIQKTVQILDPISGKKKWVSLYSKEGKELWDGTSPIREKTLTRTIKSTKMAEVENAFELSSGTRMETIYALHANKLKALGNDVRKEYLNTPSVQWNPSAKETYKSEVASLNSKLNLALRNAPFERQAQLLADTIVKTKKADNPNLEAADIKKIRGQALIEARTRMGAKKQLVEITDREWEAIQAGAISNNKLDQILNNTDPTRIKELATPRALNTASPIKQERIKAMITSGYTQSEIADALGVSASTISKLMDK